MHDEFASATLTSQTEPNMEKSAITEDAIERMVYTFYDGVRRDEVLGPVFERVLAGHWDTHLPRMVDFWSTILLGSKRFHGNVFSKHMALEGIEAEHFVRWLALFRETVTDIYDADAASEVLLAADRIANSLQLGFFGERRV
ncbi:MAG TPA: group III truncated hemoglobin [Noviherbaspirillum sp.]|nr:group III truncated hemoglobin [Noviherbaspirillum sp.]